MGTKYEAIAPLQWTLHAIAILECKQKNQRSFPIEKDFVIT
ncbi:MAG: hypothetical protein ACYTXT_08655 [Nostoc sp.]|nr:hypothetical protein [Nostoc sp. JL23]